jgi:hypothetical protein
VLGAKAFAATLKKMEEATVGEREGNNLIADGHAAKATLSRAEVVEECQHALFPVGSRTRPVRLEVGHALEASFGSNALVDEAAPQPPGAKKVGKEVHVPYSEAKR